MSDVSYREAFQRGYDACDRKNKLSGQANMKLMNEFMEVVKELNAAQAKIDSLMLEYCPDEMTRTQLAEYEKHQKPVNPL